MSIKNLLSKNKKHYPLWTRITFLVVLVLAIVVGTAFFLRANFWTVQNITVEGTKVISPEHIRQTADSFTHGSYFFIFPKRNSVIFPRETIRDALLYAYPRIGSVVVEPVGLKEFKITITEREPYALWCTGDGLSKDDPCFVIDETGYAFDHSPFFSDAVYLKYFDGSSADTNLIGRKLNPEIFLTASQFSSWLLDNTSLKPYRIVSRTFGDIDLFIEGGGKILFNGKQDAATLGSTLDSLMKSTSFRVSTGNNPSRFKSIDLRFGNKVYFVD